MAGQLGTSKGPIADINVTPLIDVVLVLLVVFMVITPMLQSGMPVDLPVATQSEVVNDVGQFIVVSVTKDNGWWVEQTEVTDATLIGAIHQEQNDNPTVNVDGVEKSRDILVKADRALPYGDVRKLMDLLAKNKFTSVLVAASKEE
jgi:biopolymer transport protein ExbD